MGILPSPRPGVIDKKLGEPAVTTPGPVVRGVEARVARGNRREAPRPRGQGDGDRGGEQEDRREGAPQEARDAQRDLAGSKIGK